MIDFAAMKTCFRLPKGVIYLDGNSLGPMPLNAMASAERAIKAEWGDMLIRAWNQAGWMDQPRRIGERIARLIGAEPDTVAVGDTLSIKVYQALAASLSLRPERRLVLSDSGNFPTDLYMADGLLRMLGGGRELKVVAPEDVEDTIDERVAVMMLTHVDYRTGRMHDMASLTQLAHEAGAIALWDLAHSAGAVPVELGETGADFAVGCTYKYLNGGPGAPAFIYARPDHISTTWPALSGWLGHQAPFAFDADYRPALGIERLRVGTPPVIQMTILEEALELWDDVDIRALRGRSIELSQLFIRSVEARCPVLRLASPRDPELRGSQVSFAFEHGYAAMQALIARGVIGDFRAPDIMRFGFTPLYIDEADVLRAAAILDDIIGKRLWDRREFHERAAVT
jgi:kynureninase